MHHNALLEREHLLPPYPAHPPHVLGVVVGVCSKIAEVTSILHLDLYDGIFFLDGRITRGRRLLFQGHREPASEEFLNVGVIQVGMLGGSPLGGEVGRRVKPGVVRHVIVNYLLASHFNLY